MSRSFGKTPQARFKVAGSSVRKQCLSDASGNSFVAVVGLVMSENTSQGVAVSVDPLVPDPGNGVRMLSSDEICERLQQWGFEIDWEVAGPQVNRKINAPKPISMAHGRGELMEVLAKESPCPAD